MGGGVGGGGLVFLRGVGVRASLSSGGVCLSSSGG